MYRYTYEDIAERYIDTVYRLALARAKSPAHAEDVTQDVFLKLLEHRQKFESEEHLKAWLLRVTINCTKDLFKSPWFRNTDQLDENTPASVPDDNGLYASLMKLPQKYRTVIHLHYYEGYSIEEIASIIKVRVGTVKSQLSRGRVLLRNILDEEVN
ncbi:MAG: RNA polymerase sigma factor [Oscillospiraceae bacterium]|nr:RNA polymerase sigma factor [Oscillospiraceae bacterium]